MNAPATKLPAALLPGATYREVSAHLGTTHERNGNKRLAALYRDLPAEILGADEPMPALSQPQS